MANFVGIDVSKATLDVFTISGDKPRHHKFGNSESGYNDMIVWLRRLRIQTFHACMEATGSYWQAFASFLVRSEIKVSVVNPACIKRFAQSELKRTKTDKVDAGIIYRFALAMVPAAWTPPSVEVQKLQAFQRRLGGLHKMRRQELNRLEAERDKTVQRSIEIVVALLDKEIEKVHKRIKALMSRETDLGKKQRLLLTIPGVGEETANLILSEVPNLDQFDGPKQLVAFAGLAPREVTSGSSVRGRAAISKTGCPRIRGGLYMATVSAMKWNPVVAEFCDRLNKRGKPPMKVIVAAMRKLLHIIWGVLKSGKPFCATVTGA